MILAVFLLHMHSSAQGSDLTVADFEGPTYGSWVTSGEAFGSGPATGTLPNQMPVSGFKGKGLVNSYLGGDSATGTLSSPPLKIQRRYLRFLIGGGKDLERTCMNLIVGGKIVRRATGQNDKPGGSEALEPDYWDVREFAGQYARIQIVDNATGGWGHINVDDIVQTDKDPSHFQTDAEREFVPPGRYLSIPIKNGAAKRLVSLLVNGKTVVRNEVELADGKPDWWATMDLGQWLEEKVRLRVDRLLSTSSALKSITRSKERKVEKDLYREAWRGQFHFSPRRGWLNDPNGLVFYNGEYHLFFQHNPYGWGWGNMHWGHAVSKDLVHWEEVGIALAPDDLGPMFSGSAVVDWSISSGLGYPNRPALVLIYTAAGDPAVQCLASSTDGRKFVKYPQNPVVPQFTPGNRDPKVIWHEPTKKWVMVLYVETAKGHTIRFLNSPNLRDWTSTSETEGLFECPDLFELPLDGDPKKSKWVLTAASSEYLVGSFDGVKFVPETPKLPGHRGKGFYAAQTFSGIPREDGRRIQIGWFQTETKGMPFNQSMSIPLELSLRTTPDGPRLAYRPVRELERLRSSSAHLEGLTLTPNSANPLGKTRAELVELKVDFRPSAGSMTTFEVRSAKIAYDADAETLEVNGHRVPAPLNKGQQKLMIFCDRPGLEVFASDGLVFVPMPFQPKASDLSLSVKVTRGSAHFDRLDVHKLRSAWPSN
ncbi:MAG: glycoside hydrolase family 32 protein [Fimbriimonadaceae bacterium]|nr:glycoside hydrolase family 32 protein [Fimbriimonadaceae bacterium]